MKKIYIYMMMLMGSLSACDDFLDVTPKGKLLPKTTQDFDEMMADPLHSSSVYPLMEMCGDNVLMTEARIKSSAKTSSGKAYLWQADFFTDEEDDKIWGDAYKAIYTFNLVLQEIDGSTEGTDADKKRVKAEAKINRAYYYWLLHSCYAKAYDEKTAATDLSVPLVVQTDLEAKSKRATAKAVVTQILEDLKDNATALPLKGQTEYRVIRTSAYALAARVQHSLGMYDEAFTNATEALKLNSTLLDYNTYSFVDPKKPYNGVTNRPISRLSPECLLYRSSSFTTMLGSTMLSDELLAKYDTLVDLRYKFNFTRIGRNGKPLTDPNPAFLQELDYNIGVPEMMLIQAECLARKGDKEALNILEKLRENRIDAAQYRKLNVPDDQLLKVVLEERERELAFHGARFFDMKRLSKEGIYTQTVVRSCDGEQYRLEPNSNRYVFPISLKLMTLNSAILPNPR